MNRTYDIALDEILAWSFTITKMLMGEVLFLLRGRSDPQRILQNGLERLAYSESKKRITRIAKLLLGENIEPLELLPMTDENAVEWIKNESLHGYTGAEAQRIVASYRSEANNRGVRNWECLHYLVRAGCTLERYAHNEEHHLYNVEYTKFLDDKPMDACLVSWIPVILKESLSPENAAGKLVKLAILRKKMSLPSHHFRSFGTLSLITCLGEELRKIGGVANHSGQRVCTDSKTLNGFRRVILYGNSVEEINISSGKLPDNTGVYAISIEPSRYKKRQPDKAPTIQNEHPPVNKSPVAEEEMDLFDDDLLSCDVGDPTVRVHKVPNRPGTKDNK